MNNLGINLKSGCKVIMQGHGSEFSRTVEVQDGFGMWNFTNGTALFVKDYSGNFIRVDAMEIEKLAEENIVAK
jgi:hypothetical protein